MAQAFADVPEFSGEERICVSTYRFENDRRFDQEAPDKMAESTATHPLVSARHRVTL